MKIEAIAEPVTYRRQETVIHLKVGVPIELPTAIAHRIIARAPGRVRVVDGLPPLNVGDVVQWRSLALPTQQAEILALYPDGTFEALHPLSEVVCRMPTAWIQRVVHASTTPEDLK